MCVTLVTMRLKSFADLFYSHFLACTFIYTIKLVGAEGVEGEYRISIRLDMEKLRQPSKEGKMKDRRLEELTQQQV